LSVASGFLLLNFGCAEWDSRPNVVDSHFGEAHRNMIANQTLCPEHGKNDDNPVMSFDGQKARRNSSL
jgi:hypothetical protein